MDTNLGGRELLALGGGDGGSDVLLEVGGHSTREGRQDRSGLTEGELGALEVLRK